jgi:pyruvate formate lyase activating enzyme
MKEALFYEKFSNSGLVECKLCPHFCFIGGGKYGFCGVRKNIKNVLYAESYGQISSIAVDPIEKKPLYHFFPGSQILSVGSYGCNMKCLFCQNHTISQSKPEIQYILPEKLLKIAVSIPQNLGVAFTYNEPLISFEYLINCAKLLKKADLKVVIVSNGMINPEPLEKLLPFADAFNVDLKSFNSDFYKKHGGNLETVKKSIEKISENCYIEVTVLVIPNENDGESEILELSEWLSEISNKIPLHFSRFFPKYKMLGHIPTPIEKLYRFAEIAKKFLKYVYIGNI